MSFLRRRARQHQAGVDAEQYWEFNPGDRVMTPEGIPGTVTDVEDSFAGSNEHYLVTLDDDLGGGEYSGEELTKISAKTAAVYMVVDDGGFIAAGPFESRLDAEDARDALQEEDPQNYPFLYIEREGAREANALMGYPEDSLAMDEAGLGTTPIEDDLTVEEEEIIATAADDYPELGDILTERPPLPHSERLAARKADTKTAGWFVEKILYPFARDFNEGLSEQNRYNFETGEMASYDWCRWRKNRRCFYPVALNEAATAEAGYNVWVPQDRGFCPRDPWDAQKDCPMSEPGPNAPPPDRPLAWGWIPWEQGGQRYDAYGNPITPPGF